jgi:FixJ family two-component response regulator
MTELLPLVFVVDDDASVRDALCGLINSVGLSAAGFGSAPEFLSCRRRDVVSCLVLDVRLPGLSGLDLQHELRKSGDDIPIVFITGYGDIPMTVRAMKAGAVEFLPKPFREQDLLDAIRKALDWAAQARARHAELETIRKRSQHLTARQHQVLAALLKGMLNKQVAADLGISEITVKIHRRHIMEKMDVSSLVELARMMERLRSDDSIPTYT